MPDHAFPIIPYGLMFGQITASSLMLIDQPCNKRRESPLPVNPAGFTLHCCSREVREDAGCVLHTHSRRRGHERAEGRRAAAEPASTPILNSSAHYDHEGIALQAEEKPRLQAKLGQISCPMLRNHGLPTLGRSSAEAFVNMYFFEYTCRIQKEAHGGGELNLIGPGLIAASANIGKAATAGQGASLAWPALLRKLDREDPGYDE